MAHMTISATTAKRLAYVENFPQVTEQSFLAKRTCPHVVSSLQPSDVLSSFGPVCIKITLFYTILNFAVGHRPASMNQKGKRVLTRELRTGTRLL